MAGCQRLKGPAKSLSVGSGELGRLGGFGVSWGNRKSCFFLVGPVGVRKDHVHVAVKKKPLGD